MNEATTTLTRTGAIWVEQRVAQVRYGYELAPHARGKGLMREALTAALDWGFTEMQVNRIEAQIHPHNEPSLRLARNLGFQQEGLLREVAHWGGSYHDLLQLGLLRRDWAPHRGAT